MYHLRSARGFLFSRSTCTKAAASSSSVPLSTATNETSAKVIYGVPPSLNNYVDDERYFKTTARVPEILNYLKRAKLTPQFRGSEIVQLQNFRTATLEDIASVHSRFYISSLEKATEDAKASEYGYVRLEDPKSTSAVTLIGDTTLTCLLDAAGVGLSVLDTVVAASKIEDRTPVGFAMLSPPGHYAGPSGAKGGSIFNYVAVAARYAQRVHGLKRVFIIDFDVHHGKGTNDAFYDDPDIFYLSTHQSPKPVIV